MPRARPRSAPVGRAVDLDGRGGRESAPSAAELDTAVVAIDAGRGWPRRAQSTWTVAVVARTGRAGRRPDE
jgi:hypothetical protein